MVCADNRPDQEIPRVANLKPAVVHECDRCHATVTPAETGQGVNVSGVIKCRVCAHMGPLRIKVVLEDRC
jgi:hypothetical protein